MKTALAEAQANLVRAQKSMAIAMNTSCRSEEYNVGDKVVLSANNLKNYCPHLLTKIKSQWLGPFAITHRVSLITYRVDLLRG